MAGQDAGPRSTGGRKLPAALVARAARFDDDPVAEGHEALVEELAAHGAWNEAVRRARAAIRGKGTVQGDAVLVTHALVRGALASRAPTRALKALDTLPAPSLLHAQGKETARLRVRALALAGRDEEARSLLERLRVVWPGEPALERLRGAVGAADASPPPRFDGLERARALFEAGHRGRALRLARRVVLRDPDDASARQLARDIAREVSARIGEGRLEPVLGDLPLPELATEGP